MQELRDKVFALVDEAVQKGAKLARGRIETCLLGVIAGPTDSPYTKSKSILGVDNDTSLALEAGFEDWRGISLIRLPEVWQIGADVYAKYVK